MVDDFGEPLGEDWNGPAQGKRKGDGSGWRNLFGGRRSADEVPAPTPLARLDRSPDSGAAPAAAPEEDSAEGAAWPRFTRWVAAQVGLGAREQAFAAQAQAHLGRQRQLQQIEGMEDASTVATRRNEASARRSDQLVEGALDEIALGMAAAPVGKGLKVLRRGADTLGERLARAARGKEGLADDAAREGRGASEGAGTALVKARPRYTAHAAERLAQRGITDDMVDAALRKGTRYWDPKDKSVNYVLEGGFARGKDLLVGTNPVTGAVTTAIRGTDLVSSRFVLLR